MCITPKSSPSPTMKLEFFHLSVIKEFIFYFLKNGIIETGVMSLLIENIAKLC